MLCDAGHKCRLVVGSPNSGSRCNHCNRMIAAGSTHALFCESCNYAHCSRCSDDPNFSTMELRKTHKPPPGCGPDCRRSHDEDGACLVCGRGIHIYKFSYRFWALWWPKIRLGTTQRPHLHDYCSSRESWFVGSRRSFSWLRCQFRWTRWRLSKTHEEFIMNANLNFEHARICVLFSTLLTAFRLIANI